MADTNKLTWKDIWGNKYHRKFILMMLNCGILIGAMMIVLNLLGKSLKFKVFAFISMMIVFVLIKHFYWKRLEVMEQQEKIIQGGNND